MLLSTSKRGFPASPMRVSIWAAIFLAAAVLLPEENGMAEAIIRRNDMPDSAYIVNRFDYPAIVGINNYFSNCKDGKNICRMYSGRNKGQVTMHGATTKGKKTIWNVSCAGTVIGRKHIITGRHCFIQEKSTGLFGYTAGFWIWVGRKRYKVKRTMVPHDCGFYDDRSGGPTVCDIAILELETKIDHRIKPYKIYDPKKFGSELHKTAEFFGWGVSGAAGTVTDKWCEQGALDGKFRKGMNTIIGLGAEGDSWGRHPNHKLRYMMRGGSDKKVCKKPKKKRMVDGIDRCHPGPGLPLEAMTGSGDSGGPLFIRVKGELHLAGVNSGNGVNQDCGYGSVDEFTRVAAFRRFITSVLNEHVTKGRDKFGHTIAYYNMPSRRPGQNRAPVFHEFGGRSWCQKKVDRYWLGFKGAFAREMCLAKKDQQKMVRATLARQVKRSERGRKGKMMLVQETPEYVPQATPPMQKKTHTHHVRHARQALRGALMVSGGGEEMIMSGGEEMIRKKKRALKTDASDEALDFDEAVGSAPWKLFDDDDDSDETTFVQSQSEVVEETLRHEKVRKAAKAAERGHQPLQGSLRHSSVLLEHLTGGDSHAKALSAVDDYAAEIKKLSSVLK